MIELAAHQAEGGKRLAGHDAGGDRRHRQADHLGDEGDGARGPGIDLEDMDLAILDGILDIHQADDIERPRQLRGLPLELGHRGLRQRPGRQRAGRVAGVDAGLLDMLRDAGHEHVGAVAQGVDIDLGRVAEITVDQHRALARHHHGLRHIALERLVVADDLHGAAAEHIGGPDHHRIADLADDAARLGSGFGDAVARLAQREAVEQLGEAVAVLSCGAEDGSVSIRAAGDIGDWNRCSGGWLTGEAE